MKKTKSKNYLIPVEIKIYSAISTEAKNKTSAIKQAKKLWKKLSKTPLLDELLDKCDEQLTESMLFAEIKSEDIEEV